jgi:hypothetical protein
MIPSAQLGHDPTKFPDLCFFILPDHGKIIQQSRSYFWKLTIIISLGRRHSYYDDPKRDIYKCTGILRPFKEFMQSLKITD